MAAQHLFFTKQLMLWHSTSNTRQLPWKHVQDPYKIWLSEILLQQTQAATVIPYYQKFIKAYPTIKKLAAAPEQEVYALWQGLGYYSRCRNMLHTARYIADKYKSTFPNSFDAILQLKGIGNYTASAIASFAYNLPHAVLDGNVYRILSRFFAQHIAIDSTEGKKYFAQLAQQLLHEQQPAMYNQAIMDFGATICKPKQALCSQCPLSSKCKAFAQNEVYTLPVKQKKIKITARHFHYIVWDSGTQLFLRQRTAKDIWQQLHDFDCIEKDNELCPELSVRLKSVPAPYCYTQQLTHQKVHTYFYVMQQKPNAKMVKAQQLIPVPYLQLKDYAMPKTIVQFLKDREYF